MNGKVTAKARVQIIVEIETSAWGGDCTLEQMYKQAAEDGLNKLRSLRYFHGGEVKEPLLIIGEPKVIGIITEKP